MFTVKHLCFSLVLVSLLFVSIVGISATELYFHLPAQSGDLLEWYEARIEAFTQKYPGVTVKVNYSVAGFAENVTLLILSGQYPDVVGVMSRDLPLWVEEDVIENLYPYIEKDPDINLDDFLHASIMHYDWDGGRLLAMPLNPDTGAVVYNTVLFNEAGISTPLDTWKQGDWTWDRLRDNAMKLTIRENETTVSQWGLRAADSWEPVWGGFIYSNGGRILDSSGNKCLLDEAAAIEAIQWLGDLYTKDRVAEWHGRAGDVEGGSVPMQIRASSAGKLAHAQGVKVDFVPLPARLPGIDPVHILLGPGLSMFKNSPNKELAWEFIKECVSHESMEELAKLTGRVPSRTSALEAWLDHYNQYVGTPGNWLEALATSDSLPYGVHWTDILPVMHEAILNVTRQGNVSAAVSLSEATRRIDAIIGH